MVVMQNVERPRMVSENGTTTTLKSGIQLKINSLRQDSFRQETFPDSSVGKESVCNARESGSIPGSGRFAGEGRGYPLQYSWVSLVAQLVKNVPAMWETWVWSLGWEDPLEKGKATHSSILAWRISWSPWEIHGVAKSQKRLRDFHFHFFSFTGS